MKIYEKKNYYEGGEYESYTHKYCPVCKQVCEISQFGKNVSKKSRLGWVYRSACYPCSRILCKEFAINNRPARNLRLRNYRKKYPEKAKLYDLRGRLKIKYGLTIEQRNEMIKDQDGRCYICGKESNRLMIDHSHKTGKVRKMLCGYCNSMLGRFEINEGMIGKFIKYMIDYCE